MGAYRSPFHQIAVLLALGLAGACSRSAPGGGGAFPPAEVSVVTLAPRTVPVSYEFSAEVVPYRHVEVRARVEGIIQERPFTEGMLVKPGQVLYRIDPARYEAAYRSAEARFQNGKARFERVEPLARQRAVAQQEVDNARSEYEAAQAALAQAKKDFDETVVRAEIEGRAGRTLLDVGARVTGPADLLTTIVRLDPVYVTFRPSSEQLLDWKTDPRSREMVRPGSRLVVEAVLPNGTVLPRTGRLDFVAPSLDAATGTQEFRAVFANRDRILVPGQFVRARLVGFTKDSALVVPVRAVQTALGRQFVYLVGKGDTVAARDIQPGAWTNGHWIIPKGLEAGDRVIVDGVQKVAPGRTARPVPLPDSAVADPPASASGRAPGAGAPR